MIELLVPQAFPALVAWPLPEESLKAGLPVLLDSGKERARDLLAVVIFGEGLAAHVFVQRDFPGEGIHRLVQVHRLVLAMELYLPVDDIVNELALDDELGREILEPPDLFGIHHRVGPDVRGDVLKIVLALAPVPDPVFGEGPGIDLEEERIQLSHRIQLESNTKYFLLLVLPGKNFKKILKFFSGKLS